MSLTWVITTWQSGQPVVIMKCWKGKNLLLKIYFAKYGFF